MGLLLRVWIAIATLFWPSLAQAAWHEARSNHFIIYADMSPDELKQYAERLERFDQAVRYMRGMQDPKLTDANRLKVYVMRSERTIARLAGAQWVAGFYRARASGSSVFVPRKVTGLYHWNFTPDVIFFHEYAHHLQLQFAAAAIPPWFSEGFAEFFGTATIEDDGNVTVGRPPQYRAWTLFSDELRIEQMLGATNRKFTGVQMAELYGKGWRLVHYLTFTPARKGQIARYMEAIQQGSSALEAGYSAFGDLRALDRELDRHRNGKIPAFVIEAKHISTGPITIRQLSPGEDAIMDVHIQSTKGASRKDAPTVAASARKLSAQFPIDPFAQAALAEAEFDAENYAAAEAAADQALASDPNNLRALIYKGRAQMELAKASPAAHDWKAIRSWFSKANKLDSDSAEPLMLFYQSYVKQGIKPTQNSVDGLLYATALAPRDYELRLMAVRQLLMDARTSDAKKLFAPLAYQPHLADEWKEVNAQIMDAINADHRSAALALMDQADKFAAEDAQKP
jgi:hypothetical protein